jgi:hypothetical protein
MYTPDRCAPGQKVVFIASFSACGRTIGFSTVGGTLGGRAIKMFVCFFKTKYANRKKDKGSS